MKKRMDKTPRSRVKNAIRRLWLYSRERSMAIKMAGNTCSCCGKKGSKAKGREVDIEVHHSRGIDWDGIVDTIIERVLQSPELLQVLCKDCHDKVHGETINGGA